jgi:hypothetical protein
MAVELPHHLGHRRAVAVDQERCAGGVDILGETGEVDLAYRVQRQRGQVLARVAAVVGAGDMDVIHVEQQAAAAAAHHLADELRLVHRRGGELDVGGRVLQQHAALERSCTRSM